MAINTILFDLDGTLLPMDQEIFTKAYFKLLTKKLMPLGYEPEKLINGVWTGTMAMIKNDGTQTNEAVFWEKFSELYGEQVKEEMSVFEEFYQQDFQNAKEFCGFNPLAGQVIQEIKNRGYRLILATNPVFPAIATESRIRWAGLLPEDFEWYTTYENSNFCKPNPAYYQAILDKLGVKPEECLMIGNDVSEDGAATQIGISLFLITDCLINKEEKDLSEIPHGNFEDLLAYIKEM